MPEGDTLFRTADRLARALSGRVVTAFESGLVHLAVVDDEAPIAGREIRAVRAVGKHLCIELSGGLVLRTHLRMSGAWHLYRAGERWRLGRARARVVLSTDAFVAVGFDIPDAEFVRSEDLAKNPSLARLGPDYLAPGFDAATVVARLRARPSLSLGEALLDQSIAAGLGNVYKSEALFACGLDPFATVGTETDDGLRGLVECAREMLLRNVRPTSGAGPHFYDGHRYTSGSAGRGERHLVYGRTGRPCTRCGASIRSVLQGAAARRTYWCPRCQGGCPSPEGMTKLGSTPAVRVRGAIR